MSSVSTALTYTVSITFDGIVDIAIGEIEVPDLGIDWQTKVRRRANSAHEMLLRHPWATIPIVSRIDVRPPMLRLIVSC